MNLFPELHKRYTEERLSAREAQRQAEFIAWAPVVFQVSRLMVKWGILDMLRDSREGLSEEEIVEKSGLSRYAVKCLLEASLSIGTVLYSSPAGGGKEGAYVLSKTGWFLLNDPATRVNIDFNHDVNYEGMFRLEESLKNGKPEGLRHFGNWTTVYEGLSSLPEQVQKSWFAFDHFYSDSSFPEALEIVFRKHKTRSLYDVGGNTGKWAMKCVEFDKDVEVTVLDLPQQVLLMQNNVNPNNNHNRIKGYSIDLLDENADFPEREGGIDAIWMSQFLDCFSEEQVVSILRRAKRVMTPQTRLYIMETLWDRQRFEPAALCLTMTSLYFTAIANGNSKMFHSEDLLRLIGEAGLRVEQIYDGLGQGHSILEVKSEE